MTNKAKAFSLVLVVVTIASLAYAFNLRSELERVANQPVVNQEEIDSLVASVGALIVLPENETPTIATVADPSKLKDQPFFAQSREGDKVLIYSQALKAILYRPSTGKIIEVSPLNVAPPPQNNAPQSTSQAADSEE